MIQSNCSTAQSTLVITQTEVPQVCDTAEILFLLRWLLFAVCKYSTEKCFHVLKTQHVFCLQSSLRKTLEECCPDWAGSSQWTRGEINVWQDCK
jgi:hypothetical protein